MYLHLQKIVERCLRHEPLDYILGVTYFFDREFQVTPAVLLPRPDTERLVETVLDFETGKESLFAEVGVGSGAVSCILTEQRPAWRAVGIDISFDALAVALLNLRSDAVSLCCADCFSAVSTVRSFDFIVSNPPYIPTGEIAGLDESVRGFEPYRSLDGGVDGLSFYRRFAREAPGYLKAGGALYCEIGSDQDSAMKFIFTPPLWGGLAYFRDLAGHPRVIRVVYQGQ